LTENVLAEKLKQYFYFKGILILVASDFLFVSGTSIWNSYLNIYFSSIGLSALDIGLVSTLQSAFSSLTMIPADIIADRIGHKRPIILSFALSPVRTLALIIVRD